MAIPSVDEEDEAVQPFSTEFQGMTLFLPSNSKQGSPQQSLALSQEHDLGQDHFNSTVAMKLPETITKTINLI